MATAGSIIGLIQNFFVIGALCEIIGAVMDGMINVSNSSQLPLQSMQNMVWMGYALQVFPILYLIALIINHLLEAKNMNTRGV
jgi:hypothetical protein